MKPPYLVLCLLALSTVTFGQVSIIPKVGFSLSNVSFSDDLRSGDDVQNKSGFTAGIGFEVALGKRFALQPELLFAQKGWKEKFEDPSASGKITQTLNYLEVPILAKVKFGFFYLNAGPSIALGLGGKYDYSVTYNNRTRTGDGKIKFGDFSNSTTSEDLYMDNNQNFGVQFGFGFAIPRSVMFDFRYGVGLSNLYDKHSEFAIEDNKSKTRSFQFTVGLPIKIGGK